jgi:nucleoside-diphosphate-sugar epimerase
MDSEPRIILITGSSGFLGQALSQHFGRQPNTQIVGFDRFESPHPNPKEECLFCDMSSDESVQKTFQLLEQRNGRKIAAVFHLAAYYSFSGEDSPMYKKVTVQGTERLLRELQGFEVGQFIFSSSMLVHKPNLPGEKITEESPIAPTWQYPASKVETEKVVTEKHGKIPSVILRIAGVYGDNCNSIPVAHQIQRIYEGQLEGHLYSGDTDVRQSFMHVDDLVDAFQAVVDHKDVLPELAVFEIGEPDAMSYEEMQKEIGMLIHGTDWKTFSVPKPIAKLGAMVEMEIPFVEKPFVKPWMVDHADDNYDISIDKAKAVLGWSPKRHMVDTIPKMIAKLKADPIGFYKINDLKAPSWLKDKQPEAVAAPAASQS